MKKYVLISSQYVCARVRTRRSFAFLYITLFHFHFQYSPIHMILSYAFLWQAVALLLEWSRWGDQEFLSSLSDLIARDVTRLDQTITATTADDASTAPAEQYNMLTFNRCTSAIGGWANRSTCV